MAWHERLRLREVPFSSLFLIAVAGVSVVGVTVYALERFVVSISYPPTIPLVGEKKGSRRFGWRTRLRYYTDCKGLFLEAWDNFLVKGQPVVVPGMGFRKEVIMPPSYLRWVLSQPDAVLNTAQAMAEVDQAKYSLGHEGPVTDSWQGMLVKTELNRVLEGICVALSEELGLAFDAHFGKDTENWKEIDLRATVSKAIAQANGRFTVGLPLCRDPDYLNTVLGINDGLITFGGLLSGAPLLLRPLLGSTLTKPLRWNLKKISKWLVPLWRERLDLASSLAIDDQPQDHVQMMARFAKKERPQEVDDLDLIVSRISAQNFGAVHQTSIQVSNFLLDIMASNNEYDTIDKLRNECAEILGEASEKETDEVRQAKWTKVKVNKMVLADSAARETLRLHSFANRAILRKVMAPNFMTPDGHHLPQGTLISFISYAPQTSADYYRDPSKYDPWRFAKARETTSTPVSFVSTGHDYLPFGHGRHACPGRFLVDFELKMITSHVLRCYDIKFPDEYAGRRPENVWLAEATFPPPGVKICIKRRKGFN
ncbi:hypothetical protein N3K66_005380 [Trichothecium roseum]|uniref:Uncharacterized protein n=1 Tax=Trichothecium roseum TaxID=47278 RepID=A0ACC0UXS0_9HYPO|nr:hypothetical protein N3K66_005380 [Trichothecium roseum]